MNIRDFLVFDIETHYGVDWKDRSEAFQEAFKCHYWDEQAYPDPEDHYKEIAGLHAELSHVICVSLGFEDTKGEWHCTSICGADEVELLKKLANVLSKFHAYKLLGWNSFNCDTPYLIKRYIINHLPVPAMLKDADQKPWERGDCDAAQVWKYGTFRMTSLQMVGAALGHKVKTDDLGGGNLYKYPLNEMPWDELAHYCEEDVHCTYLSAKDMFTYYGE